MKIVVGLYYYVPYISGLSEYARRVAEGLAKDRFEVTVVCMQHGKSLPEREVIAAVEVLRVPILFKLGKGAVSPTFTKMLVRLSRGADIVHLHLPLAESGLIARLIDSRKLVITYHCDVFLGRSLSSRIIEHASYASMRRALSRAAAIVGNSKDYLAASKLSRELERASAVPPPIDTAKFRRARDSGLRKRLEVDDGDFLIGFVGRIVYEKGLDVLFESVVHLEKMIGSFRILVVGDTSVAGGSILPDLEPYLRQHGDKISLLGRLTHEDLVAFYSAIDVLVLPSIDPLESFGMVQVEAMCCGTPVVASDMPGVRDVVSRTGFGALAEAGNALHLAEAISRIYGHDYDDTRFLREEWDIRRTLDHYKRVFSAISAPPAPRRS